MVLSTTSKKILMKNQCWGIDSEHMEEECVFMKKQLRFYLVCDHPSKNEFVFKLRTIYILKKKTFESDECVKGIWSKNVVLLSKNKIQTLQFSKVLKTNGKN